MRRTLAATAVVAALALVAACGTDAEEPAADASPSATPTSASPSATEEAEPEGVTIDVLLTADGPEPQGERVEVKVGEPVTLVVTSEVTDEVHVHSDPEHSLDVEPGDTEELTFTVDRPGQVAVESHAAHATIVQLVVRP